MGRLLRIGNMIGKCLAHTPIRVPARIASWKFGANVVESKKLDDSANAYCVTISVVMQLKAMAKSTV